MSVRPGRSPRIFVILALAAAAGVATFAVTARVAAGIHGGRSHRYMLVELPTDSGVDQLLAASREADVSGGRRPAEHADSRDA